ncbi:alpha/beta fold hydrolase [Pseudomonas syringae]|uniref:alpha/beta fold hydrolase n=1 Tax=Pseudomonas syringae TaxID=317 RepID=UPI000416A8D2|nr:alpha/beta fold hydrolase [Pseudomonas syringae]
MTHPDALSLSALQKLFADALLEVEPLDADEPYIERGVDSILAAQLAKAIAQRFAVPCRTADLFEAASLRELLKLLQVRIEPSTTTRTTPNENPRSKTGRTPVIVGAAGRFPGAASLDELWAVLESGKPQTGVMGEHKRTGSFKGGFLRDIDAFDNGFFHLSPNESVCVDPQQRLSLEQAWHAIECSGLTLTELKTLRCGVFATGLPGDYRHVLSAHSEQAISAAAFTGNAFSALAGRIAYCFDLPGPVLSIDTACSSFLVALHQAAMALRSGECDAAIVCAATLFCTDEVFRLAQASQVLSASGHCLAFDERADGFAPAEGAGALLLTTQEVAQNLGLAMLAQLDGSAVGHDGRSNGLMSPSVSGQTEVIRAAWEDARRQGGQGPEHIALIETHGTGTPVGDPLEAKALAQTYGELEGQGLRYLGANKTIFGHTLVSSGLLSVLKALLVLDRQQIPGPLLRPSSSSHWHDIMPVSSPHTAHALPPGAGIAISAFGFTGVNAHVLLHKPGSASAVQVDIEGLCISAASEAGLQRTALLLARFLAQGTLSYAQVCASCAARTPQAVRAVVCAEQVDQVVDALARWGRSTPTGVVVARDYQELPASTRRPDGVAARWLQGMATRMGVSQAIHVPPYPFARRAFWPGLPSTATDQDNAGGSANVLEELRQRLAQLCGYLLEEVDSQAPLSSLGLDSLTVLQLLAPFQKRSGKIAVEQAFAASTLAELATLIERAAQSGRVADQAATDLPLGLRRRQTRSGLTVLDQAGNLPPVILVSPLNASPRIWVQQLPMLRRDGWNPCIVELPLHDAVQPDTPEIDLGRVAAQLAQLCEELSVAGQPVPCIGWSLGGCVALHAALQHSPCVGPITVISAAPWFGETILEDTLQAQSELEGRGEMFDQILPGNGSVASRIGAGLNLRSLGAYINALSTFDIREALGDLNVPLLVIHGAQDNVIQAQCVMPLRQLEKARFLEIADAGHFSPLTHATLVNRTLLDWLHVSKPSANVTQVA